MAILGRGSGGSAVAPDPDPANEIQTITFSGGTPTGGTWAATFDGETASSLAHNIDAATLQAALEGLASVGSGNATVSGSVGSGFTVTFIGALAGTNVPEMTADGSGLTQAAGSITVETLTPGTTGSAGTAAVQTITLTADGGTWTIGGNFLAWDAFPGDVESVIESVSGQAVTVSGPSGGPYVVTWDVAGIRSPIVVVDTGLTSGGGQGSASVQETTPGVDPVSGVAEVQRVTLPAGTSGGTWLLGVTSLDSDASAGEVDAAVEVTLSQTVGVSGSDGGPYTITWDETGDRVLLAPVSGISLTKGGITATVSTVQAGG